MQPKFGYSGLTIILGQASRHDRTTLLEGVAGWFFNKECLEPHTNIYCSDVRLADDPSPILPNTKVILLLGAKAFAKYTNSMLTLDEGRGSPFYYKDIVCIPSFSAQDAVDLKDYEGAFHEAEDEMDTEELDAGEIFASKGRGRTARSNYRFWLKADAKKAIKILENDGKIPRLYASDPTYIIDPPLDFICRRLGASRNTEFYFDMETDFTSMDMRCFACSFGDDPFTIYSIPTLTTDYKPYYGKEQSLLHRYLSNAIMGNTIVAHNGSQFDFFVLAYKYRMAINRCYDTLLAQHKIFPTIEKSLGHCISYHTFEPFHKNEGAHGYMNHSQAEQLYKYCGKDVFTMYLVKQGQDKMASLDEGLVRSIKQSNDAVKPYLTTTILGMHYNEQKRADWVTLNDRLMTQYLKVMDKLMGGEVPALISNKKCTSYFHEMLGYPIVKRTKTGGSSLSEDALYKFALKVNNPVIKFLIRYRQTQKQSGTLAFNPWINRNPKQPILL